MPYAIDHQPILMFSLWKDQLLCPTSVTQLHHLGHLWMPGVKGTSHTDSLSLRIEILEIDAMARRREGIRFRLLLP